MVLFSTHHCLCSDKREKERGSRQQDLRQHGLSKAGTVGSVGRGSMNHQPFSNSEYPIDQTDINGLSHSDSHS